MKTVFEFIYLNLFQALLLQPFFRHCWIIWITKCGPATINSLPLGYYTRGLSTATIEYSSACVCVSVCVSVCLSVCL